MVHFAYDRKPENSDAYRRLFAGYDVVFSARYMHNFAGGSAEVAFPSLKDEGESQCEQIYTRIVVAFDGQMHACCLDAEGHNIIGDITKGDTIASAWNGTAMQRIRRLTNERRLDDLKPCDNCDMLRRKDKRPPPRLIEGILWRLLQPRGQH